MLRIFHLLRDRLRGALATFVLCGATRREHLDARGDHRERRRDFVRDARCKRAHRRELVRACEALVAPFLRAFHVELAREQVFFALNAQRDAAQPEHHERGERDAEKQTIARAKLAIANVKRGRDDRNRATIRASRDPRDRRPLRKPERESLRTRKLHRAIAARHRGSQRLRFDRRSIRACERSVGLLEHDELVNHRRDVRRCDRIGEHRLIAREIRERFIAFAACVEIERDRRDRDDRDHRAENQNAFQSSSFSRSFASTLKSSSVDVSPFVSSAPDAISFKSRRMIFPLRVFGSESVNRI